MRWLVLAFLVSLVALLVAVVGMIRHVWLHPRKIRLEQAALATDKRNTGNRQAPAEEQPEEEPDLN